MSGVDFPTEPGWWLRKGDPALADARVVTPGVAVLIYDCGRTDRHLEWVAGSRHDTDARRGLVMNDGSWITRLYTRDELTIAVDAAVRQAVAAAKVQP